MKMVHPADSKLINDADKGMLRYTRQCWYLPTRAYALKLSLPAPEEKRSGIASALESLAIRYRAGESTSVSAAED